MENDFQKSEDNEESILSELYSTKYYTCEICKTIPQLILYDNKVEIKCQCNPSNSKEISIEEFMNKAKTNSCYNHPSIKGEKYCCLCSNWLCAKCLEIHNKKYMDHKLKKSLITTPKKCQEKKCENESTNYCRECMKYLCDDCLSNYHISHISSEIDFNIKDKILQDTNQKLIDTLNLYQQVKNTKDKLIDKIDDIFRTYEQNMNNFFNYYSIIFSTYTCIDEDVFDYNGIHNLELTIPYLGKQNELNADNLNEGSIKAYFDICLNTNKCKTLDVFSNGDKYDGEMQNGMNDGFGTYYWNNGSIYEGKWAKGLKEGFGKEFFLNQDFYEGYFHNDQRNGFGKFYYNNDGSRYEGNWMDNLKNGFGTFFNKNNVIEFQGQWKNNIPLFN